MSAEETRNAGDRQRFAELKKALATMTGGERVAYEVRLAREHGMTVSATEAAAVLTPAERRMRVEFAAAPPATALLAGHEGGQSGDLDLRRSMAEVLRTSAFVPPVQVGTVREMLRSMRSTSVETMITRLDPQLELLAAHGEYEDLIREAKTMVAQTLFAAADPMKSRKGVGGEPNS